MAGRIQCVPSGLSRQAQRAEFGSALPLLCFTLGDVQQQQLGLWAWLGFPALPWGASPIA